MNSWLAAYTSLPNLHPALVHFPIALLIAALVLDIATLLARRRWWTDPAAAALYAAGAIGAGAAYLAGEAAEDSLTGVSPAAQLALAAHADWALRTLLWFATLALARLLVALHDRGSDDIRMRWARVGLLLGGLAGQYLLFQTADRGGALVYRHGVAVARPASTQPHPAPNAAAPATGTPESRFQRSENGAILWTPAASDSAFFDTVLGPVPGSDASSAVRPGPGDHQPGLSLQVSGRALLVLPGTFENVQMEAELDLGGYHGLIGLAHHVQAAEQAFIFRLGREGKADLVRMDHNKISTLDEASIQWPLGMTKLAVSTAGMHTKGMIDGATIVHGHAMSSGPGAAGLFFDGRGTVRLLSVQVVPVKTE